MNEKEIENFDGSIGNNIASTAAYLIDLGIKTHLSAKRNLDRFDLTNYKSELLIRSLQSVQMNKAIINILNELPEFHGRELFKEFFNKNDACKNWITKQKEKSFN